MDTETPVGPKRRRQRAGASLALTAGLGAGLVTGASVLGAGAEDEPSPVTSPVFEVATIGEVPEELAAYDECMSDALATGGADLEFAAGPPPPIVVADDGSLVTLTDTPGTITITGTVDDYSVETAGGASRAEPHMVEAVPMAGATLNGAAFDGAAFEAAAAACEDLLPAEMLMAPAFSFGVVSAEPTD